MAAPRFLVLSIGNPLPVYNSLHSAGHFALQSCQRLLAPEQPSWTVGEHGGRPCLASSGSPYTFIQSPTTMNVSGPWVSKVWHDMLQKESLSVSDLGLVVVHDELEDAFGQTRLRSWNSSHRGHNGVKSTKTQLNKQQVPGARWWRISVGIDRPPSRDLDAVAAYVLRAMTQEQRDVIEHQAGPRILSCLEQIQQEWHKLERRNSSTK